MTLVGDRVLCTFCDSKLMTSYVKDSFRHVRCTFCHHIFLNPIPTAQELELLYGENYRNDGFGLFQRYQVRKWVKMIARLSKQYFLNPRILDVGCADGFILESLFHFGLNNSLGIEINEKLCKIAESRGVAVKKMSIAELPNLGERFDILIAGDVIEHTESPSAFLEDCISLMNPGALLIICTPNLDSYWSRLTEIASNYLNIGWSCLTPPWHTNNFTYTSISRIIASKNLEVVASSSRHHSLIYELSSLHLFSKFKSDSNVRNLVKLLLGYSTYFILHLITLLLLKKSSRHRLTLVLTPKS